MPASTPEGIVKAEIVKHLADIHRVDKSLCYRVIPVTKMPTRYLKNPLTGLPDIWFVVNGQSCWIETKDPAKGKPMFRDSQKPVASELIEAGCELLLTCSADEAKAFIARMRARYGRKSLPHPMDAR